MCLDTKLINEAIEDMGSGMGISLASLLYYSPIDLDLTDSAKEILETRLLTIQNTYKASVLPKIRYLVTALNGVDLTKIPENKKDFLNQFSLMRPEEVRDVLVQTYKEQKEYIDIDDVTKNALLSDRQLEENNFINFYINQEAGVMVAYRFKKPDSKKNKIQQKYDFLFIDEDGIKKNSKEKEKVLNRYYEFLMELSQDQQTFWPKYECYLKKYGNDMCSMMAGDYFGVEITNLNKAKADDRMEQIAKVMPDFKGFDVIIHAVDDHRNRRLKGRPGGFHITLTDKGLHNFPLEVKYVGLNDAILYRFSRHSEFFYTNRGKKTQFISK